MDPGLAFWTFAFVDLCAVVGFAVAGVIAMRHGDVTRHHRRMLTAAAGVGLFLASYCVKLAVLGREDLASWEIESVWALRIHELCVLAMLAGGAVAGTRALRLRKTRNATRDPGDPAAPVSLVKWHRGGGWTAVCAAALGLGFAGLVLLGMYRRAGWL